MQLTTKQRNSFENKYIPEPNSGCYLWLAHTNRGGYGTFSIRGNIPRQILAHRMAWLLYNGDIPKNKYVLHKCDTPSCVNPTHLFLGTYQDNSNDMINKKRGNNQVKTHCKNGHEFIGNNLYQARNHRQCRKCVAAASRRYRGKIRENSYAT